MIIPYAHSEKYRFLDKLMSDERDQPVWRFNSAMAHAYYDDKQLSSIAIRTLQERGQPVVVFNMIKPTVNAVLGMEEKTRTDWMIKADDKKGAPVAEAINERLHEVARTSGSHQARGGAYANQVKGGIGWIEFLPNDDVFGSQYKSTSVPWQEMSWDWSAVEPDLSDSRWMKRSRFFDKDMVKMWFPQHSKLIDSVFSGWSEMSQASEEAGMYTPDLLHAYQQEASVDYDYTHWTKDDREKVLVSHIFYKVPAMGEVIFLGDRRELFNAKNPMHIQALMGGTARVQKCPYMKLKMAYFLGSHCLWDGDSPLPHNYYPWVPFIAYRENDTKVPYGMIRSMIPVQDDMNIRRSYMTYLLRARRLIMDKDALDMTPAQIREELERPDGVFFMNPKRKNMEFGKFEIQSELGVADRQAQLAEGDKHLIQETAGVFQAQLGQAGAADSGVAIAQLIEQGNISTAEINANYIFSSRRLGEIQTAHVIDDLKNRANVKVSVGLHSMRKTKDVVLNEVTESGVNNAVAQTMMHVDLAPVSTTSTYRAQLFDRFMQIINVMPDSVKAVLLARLVDLADLPDKDEVVRDIKQAMGQALDEEDLTPEQQQQMQEAQALEQKIKQMQMEAEQLNLERAAAENGKIHSETKLNEARAQSEQTKASEMVARIIGQHLQNDMQKTHVQQMNEHSADQVLERLFAQLQ